MDPGRLPIGSYQDSLFALASHRMIAPTVSGWGESFGFAHIGITHLKPPLLGCGMVTI